MDLGMHATGPVDPATLAAEARLMMLPARVAGLQLRRFQAAPPPAS